MNRLLFFFLIAIVVYWWLRRSRTNVGRDDRARPREAEKMVSCSYCGLHIPQNESVADHGRHYCGEEHRRLGAGSRRD